MLTYDANLESFIPLGHPSDNAIYQGGLQGAGQWQFQSEASSAQCPGGKVILTQSDNTVLTMCSSGGRGKPVITLTPGTSAAATAASAKQFLAPTSTAALGYTPASEAYPAPAIGKYLPALVSPNKPLMIKSSLMSSSGAGAGSGSGSGSESFSEESYESSSSSRVAGWGNFAAPWIAPQFVAANRNLGLSLATNPLGLGIGIGGVSALNNVNTLGAVDFTTTPLTTTATATGVGGVATATTTGFAPPVLPSTFASIPGTFGNLVRNVNNVNVLPLSSSTVTTLANPSEEFVKTTVTSVQPFVTETTTLSQVSNGIDCVI